MHVKRHLSRLFGSLRRKDNKNLSEKVLQQLQSRDKQTSSRWELLDHDRDEEGNTQKAPADTEHQRTFKTSNKTDCLSPYHEVQVELTSHSNPKRCKNHKDYAELPKTTTTTSTITKFPQEEPHPVYNSNTSSRKCAAVENVTSVVQQINETISLINEFDPAAVTVQSKAEADGNFPKPFQAPRTFWIDTTDSNNEGNQNRNNLDTISRVEEGTRLTRGILSQSLEKDVINLAKNEEMGATVFVLEDEDRESDDYPNWVKSASSGGGGGGRRGSGSEITGTLARESSSSTSRPGAGRRRSLRNSGRRLYNKIHKRFNKKSDESGNTTYDDDYYGGGGGGGTSDTRTSIPANSPCTIKDGCCKGDEIKSIDGGGLLGKDASRKSSRGGKLSRSFRKVISFPRSSFQPLDSNPMEQEVLDRIEEVKDCRESGSGKLQRKLSMRALRTPGKGMKKILMKGVTAFGKSMIHASAVMPTQYECPAPSNYEEPYWGEEDYFYDFRRRYCQSTEGMDYQDRLSRSSRMNGYYQHGYCYNG